MAVPVSILEEWESLSEENRIKAQNYIRSLLNQEKPEADKQGSFPFGLWEGGLLYMSDDFNAIPEGFEDYL